MCFIMNMKLTIYLFYFVLNVFVALLLNAHDAKLSYLFWALFLAKDENDE